MNKWRPFIKRPEEDWVLGDYYEEMKRRRALARRNRYWSIIGLACALGLIWWGIQPLGLNLWHQVALLAGLVWLCIIAEGPAEQLADEMDLLEKKIVSELNKDATTK